MEVPMGKMIMSDVDGTIVRGSLVLRHAVFLEREGLVKLNGLGEAWKGDQKNEALISSLAETYRAEIKGMNVEDMAVNGYIDSIVSNKDNFYSVLDRLIDYKANGDHVLLISGSPDFLVNPFAEKFGFEGVGSTYHMDSNQRLNGKVNGMFNGDAKRNYVASLGLQAYSDIIAFGDTQSDKPLFESASYNVLVEPTNETREALGSMVHEIINN